MKYFTSSKNLILGKATILLVDDHKIFLEGLKALLGNEEDLEIVGAVHDGGLAFAKVRAFNPDIVILDLMMPGENGIELCRRICTATRKVCVIILSGTDDERYIIEAFRAGALGYLIKLSFFNEILAAIHAVRAGRKYLSGSLSAVFLEKYLSLLPGVNPKEDKILSVKEREILKLIAGGQNTKWIASQLEISVKTVETHRLNIMKKLKINNLPELTKYAIRSGLSDLKICHPD